TPYDEASFGVEQAPRSNEGSEWIRKVFEHVGKVDDVVALLDRCEWSRMDGQADRSAGRSRGLGYQLLPLRTQAERWGGAKKLPRAAAHIEDAPTGPAPCDQRRRGVDLGAKLGIGG